MNIIAEQQGTRVIGIAAIIANVIRGRSIFSGYNIFQRKENWVIYVACNLRTCAVCRLHGAKYAVCRLHGMQSADCMVTVQTNSFSKFQRNLRFSARINFLTKLPNQKENNLCLFDNGYYSFSCL